MLSLCLTLKNENINGLVSQIASQTVLADESVIIDSGKKAWKSPRKDEICKKLKIIYVFQKCTRGEGRNKAASVASHENLMFLDGGSTFDKNAVKQMASSLNKADSEIIAGKYQSVSKNFQEYIFALFLNKDISKANVYYPSARIFGIKKRIFLKLKGFNEKMSSAEDTEFFKRAVDQGFKIEKNVKSLTTWHLPSFSSYFVKIFTYAEGDAQSDIWWDARKKFGTHNIKHLLTVLRWCVLIGLVFLGFRRAFGLLLFVYLYSVALKRKIDFLEFSNKNPLLVSRNFCLYVIIKTGTDFAAIFGFIKGFF